MGKKCMDYEVEGVRTREVRQENFGVGLWKKSVRSENYTRKMLWTVVNGES